MSPLPILPAITGVATSAMNIFGNAAAQRRANRQNIAFWRMQNEYNSPASQMQRLREAGLNPNLVYGNSANTGNAGAIAPAKAAKFEAKNPIENLSAIANLKQVRAQTDNLKRQNTVLAQEALLKAAQTAGLAASTAKTKFDLGLARDLRRTSLQAAEANVRSIEQGIIGKSLDNTLKSKTMKDAISRLYYDVQMAKASLKGSKLTNRLKELEIDLQKMGIQKGDAWYWRVFGRGVNYLKDNPGALHILQRSLNKGF